MKTKIFLSLAFVLSLFFANATTVQGFGYNSGDNWISVDLEITGGALPENCSWAFIPKGSFIPVSVGDMPMSTNTTSFTGEGLPSGDYMVRFMFNDGTTEYREASTTNSVTTGITLKPTVEPASMVVSDKVMTVKIPDEFLGRTITVYSTNGQSQMTVLLAENTQSVDLGTLAKGIYVVAVNAGGPVIGRANLFQ